MSWHPGSVRSLPGPSCPSGGGRLPLRTVPSLGRGGWLAVAHGGGIGRPLSSVLAFPLIGHGGVDIDPLYQQSHVLEEKLEVLGLVPDLDLDYVVGVVIIAVYIPPDHLDASDCSSEPVRPLFDGQHLAVLVEEFPHVRVSQPCGFPECPVRVDEVG